METIMVKKKYLVLNERSCYELGIDPYYLNVGGDGEVWVEIKLEDTIRWELI